MTEATDLIKKNMDRVESLLRECVKAEGEKIVRDYIWDIYKGNEEITLSSETDARMSTRLLEYPIEARNLLFGEYCFHMTYESIKENFGIKNPEENIAWYKRLLADECELGSNQRISETSLRRISERALEIHVQNLERQARRTKANVFKRGIKTRGQRAATYIATAAAVFIFMFTATVTVNAEFRERVIQWFVQSFDEFSIFKAHSEAEADVDTVKLYEPTFIPDRYQYSDRVELPNGVRYIYVDQEGYTLFIIMMVPGSELAINTEGMEVTEALYEGESSFYYRGENQNNYVFLKDSYPMYIMGEVTMEECEKIANSIKKMK